ncbi:hypothetical protein [Helicobacter bilis]|uniref:hypothetical protein n=2 Tax=Helicobacter TaxID=209 RepID=UPI00248EEE5B|nr:hypothetical protein [Helicobacter bilis]
MQDSLYTFMESDAYMQGIFLHEIFACLFFIPYLWYLFILYRAKTFLDMNRKIYFVMPITIFLLGVGIITGGFLLAMRGFILDIRIIVMIVALLLFLVGEIYRMKTLKKARISKEGMQRYRQTCKIMYLIFVVVFVCVVGFIKAYKGQYAVFLS